MKKVLLIGLIIALGLIVIGGAGVVYARMSGVDANELVALDTTQNGATILRQFKNGQVVIEKSYGLQDEFGIRLGPGGMMGEYGSGTCPGDFSQGYGPGGMMQGNGRGGMMQGYNSDCEIQGYGTGGMMGGRGNGYGPGGMMGRRGLDGARGEGPMHEYMISAFAAALDLTAQEVETRHEAGETFQEIAIAQGIAEADLPDLLIQVRQAALDAAVADGTITQAQADFMLERMENRQEQGFAPGFDGCPMMDGDEEQQP